jgi:hypothetical protein
MGDDRVAAKPAQAARSDSGWRARLLVCLLVPGVVAWLMTTVWVPLETHQAEEYVALAQSPNASPSLLRPPGYVAFLRIVGGWEGGSPAGDYRAVYLAQAVLLGLATAAFFLVARRWLEPAAACVLALAFGCHPLALVLVGYLHYDLLHLTLLVFTSWCLVNGFGSARVSWAWVVLAGVAAGLTTLTRPMTLALPVILALALGWLRGGERRRYALAWAVCVAAMGLTIAPRTLGNFLRTGRVIPVNAQTGAAFWPMTDVALHPTSDNFPWVNEWHENGEPLAIRKLGPAAGRSDAFMTLTLPLDDLLKARAWELFRAQPSIYFENVAGNLLFFWTGDSRRLIKAFQFYQVADRPSATDKWVIGYYVFASAALHLLAACGFAVAWWRRERALVLAGSVFLTLWLVHAVVYLDARYLYAGLPFFLWFAAYGLRELLPARWPRDLAACGALVALSVIGCFALLA